MASRRFFLIRVFLCIILVGIVTGILISCRGMWFGEADSYVSETVMSSVDPSGKTAEALLEILDMMAGPRAQFQPFCGCGEAVRAYSEIVLSNLFCKNYARYVGNAAQLMAASDAYPELHITTLIGAGEYDRLMSKCFGGSGIASGGRFIYLDRVNAYTTMAQPEASTVQIRALDVSETENTYRLHFSSSDAESGYGEYLAIFVKRPDGTSYLHALLAA